LRAWGIHRFLNPPASQDLGWIKGVISPKTYKNLPEIELVIADCSRSVRLDFSAHTLAEVRDRRRKLRVLEDAVSKFCWQAEKALDECDRLLTPKEIQDD
jgi:hypothetical protein